MRKFKEFISAHPKFFNFAFAIYNHLHFKNKLHTKGIKLSAGLTMLNGLKIKSSGFNNEIILGDFVRMVGCTIIIYGNNNRITINKYSYLNQVELYIEDDYNEIIIGEHTSLCGRAHLAAIEGTKIVIGDNCLFSSDLHFRTGDSHSIIGVSGKRINASKDIIIGNHVWIGTKVTCLKDVLVSDNSIVAATTTLCKHYDTSNCIIGGVPGKVIKTEINWMHERIKIED